MYILAASLISRSVPFNETMKIDIGVSTYIRDATATSELLKRKDVDAIEIHTSGRYSF